jgi:hypothetical protein
MPNLSAEQLAKSLAAQFLENGNYEALGTPLSHAAASKYAQAAAERGFADFFEQEEAFSGLAVHSVGYTKGREVEEVVIYVTKGSKKALGELATELHGIPIEVRLMGKLKAGPAPAQGAYGSSHFFEFNGRIACGSSCAPSRETYSGTFGALVRNGQTFYALSNNHVFAACNHTPVGMPILAPSTSDASPGRRAPTAFCEHDRIVELRSGEPTLVLIMRLDVAVARVTSLDLVTSWQGETSIGYDTPSTIVEPQSGLQVKKVGRTTGLTYGTVEALVPTPWVLPYRSGRFTAAVWFTDTWTIRTKDGDPFALPGDSGSLIVTEDGTAAVGLLFAVNNRGEYGIVMPIGQVLQDLGGFQLVSGHGV